MPHFSDNPRYIVTSGSWLVVAIRVVGHGNSRDRLVTKSFKVVQGQSPVAAMALLTNGQSPRRFSGAYSDEFHYRLQSNASNSDLNPPLFPISFRQPPAMPLTGPFRQLEFSAEDASLRRWRSH